MKTAAPEDCRKALASLTDAEIMWAFAERLERNPQLAERVAESVLRALGIEPAGNCR